MTTTMNMTMAAAPPQGSVRASVRKSARRPVRASVRAAGLVDVPAVARLVTRSEPSRRAMRLLLAHHVMEEGRVWVAERDDGTLLAAGIRLPPGIGADPPGASPSTPSGTSPSTPPGAPSGPRPRSDEPYWTLVTVRGAAV